MAIQALEPAGPGGTFDPSVVADRHVDVHDMVRWSRRASWRWAAPLLLFAIYAACGDGARAWLSAGGAIAAAIGAAVCAGRRASVRWPWVLLALGLVSNAAGDVLYTITSFRHGGDVPFPSSIDGLYLGFYPLFGVGLWLMARARGRERTSLIDAAIVAIGSGVVVWQFLVLPLANDRTMSLSARLVSGGYPVGDLVLLAFLARLAFGQGGRSTALRLLAIGTSVMFVADIGFLGSDLYGGYNPGSWPDAMYLLAYVMLLSAALHPSAAEIDNATGTGRAHIGWGRLAVLTSTTLLAPLVTIATSGSLQLPAVASALLFLLVMTRIAGLLRALSHSGERRFESLVANSSELVAIISGATVRYASPSMLAAVGLDPAEAATFTLDLLVHPDDRDDVAVLLSSAERAAPRESVNGEFRVRWPGRDGWRVVAAVVMNLIDDPDVGGVVLNARDIDQLRQLASFDPLTGLANRSEFAARLESAIADEQPMNVLLFDLDGFKEVNDSLGHHAGDAVLREAAHRLQQLAESTDLVARLGGDEFAVLQRDSRTTRAHELAASALELLRRPIQVEGVAVGVGASVGIVHNAGTVIRGEELVRCADIAMYRAKGDGKGRAVLYTDAMGEPVRRRLELRNALEHALAGREMEVHYQPLCRLDSGETLGFEALLRWHHPTQGPITPAEFIPAAEESHHIITLGRWVLDQAVHQLAMWQRLAPCWQRLSMSVNVSPRQLHDPVLVPCVEQLIADTAIDPASLILEITEQAVVDNPSAAVAVLRRLKELGVRLAIDDYGSGNASINYLRQFPIDELKIDRTLVAPLTGDTDASQALVKSILELAAALDMETVAEGIETAEQAAALRSLGATQGQGYLLGYPSSATAATALLEQHTRNRDRLAWASAAPGRLASPFAST